MVSVLKKQSLDYSFENRTRYEISEMIFDILYTK